MHICMVSTGFDPILPEQIGAIEPYVYGLSKELSRKHLVDVFGFGEGSEKTGNLCIQTFSFNAKIISLCTRTHRELVRASLFNTYLLQNIFHLHKKCPIDIIHIHAIYSGFTATFCKLTLGIPFVCSIHNEVRTSLPFQACDQILANSMYIKEFLSNKRGVNENRIKVVPPAIDVNIKTEKDKEQVKKDLGLFDRNVLLFVGRKCPEKGPQILIEALPAIVKDYPETLAVFVGPDYFFGSHSTTYTEFLVAKAKKLKVEDHVIFKSFIQKSFLNLYYTAADMFVFPSIWREPFGIVLLEALAYEKPVIASNVGGVPEVIHDKTNGLLIPPNNSKALAEAITSLMENTHLARRLGESGRDMVRQNFSFEAVSKRILNIYKAAIS